MTEKDALEVRQLKAKLLRMREFWKEELTDRELVFLIKLLDSMIKIGELVGVPLERH